MGKGLIILMAALLLALTLACEMAGGISNALQDEPGDAGEVVEVAKEAVGSAGDSVKGAVDGVPSTDAPSVADGTSAFLDGCQERREAIAEWSKERIDQAVLDWLDGKIPDEPRLNAWHRRYGKEASQLHNELTSNCLAAGEGHLSDAEKDLWVNSGVFCPGGEPYWPGSICPTRWR